VRPWAEGPYARLRIPVFLVVCRSPGQSHRKTRPAAGNRENFRLWLGEIWKKTWKFTFPFQEKTMSFSLALALIKLAEKRRKIRVHIGIIKIVDCYLLFSQFDLHKIPVWKKYSHPKQEWCYLNCFQTTLISVLGNAWLQINRYIFVIM